MRVHRPEAGEILSSDEERAVRAALESVQGCVEAHCPGAEVVFATADVSWGPSEKGPAGERLVTLRILYAISTRVRLGLHAWRATVEGVFDEDTIDVHWVAHEVEKGLRTASRQSWFNIALLGGAEIVPSQGLWTGLPAELARMVARESAQTLVDLAQGFVTHGFNGEALRLGLAAIRLAGGLLALRAPRQFQSADHGVDASLVLERAAEAIASSSLPQSPPEYSEVSDWLVAVRLEQTGLS